MKDFFKPANLLFYFFTLIVFFILGIIYANIVDAAKNQGLAGGAIVLGYGVIGGVIGFLAAIIFAGGGILKRSVVVFLNKVFGVIFIGFVVFIIVRIMILQSNSESQNDSTPSRQKTAIISPKSAAAEPLQSASSPMGIGMVKPQFFARHVLRFYNRPDNRKPLMEHTPTDSLIFEKTERGLAIAYAPPWFAPMHLKMDYEVLFLRALSISEDFIEVMVNEHTGITRFIDRKNELLYWPDFLLRINSIEQLEPQNNPVRIKPLTHASIVSTKYEFLKPLRVSQEWVYVELLNGSFTSQGKGWIRWTKDGLLLIRYSLFG